MMDGPEAKSAGMVRLKPPKPPSLSAWTKPRLFPASETWCFRKRSIVEPGSKPDPVTPTVEPGRAREGLSRTSGPIVVTIWLGEVITWAAPGDALRFWPAGVGARKAD